ncbi:unnamed protein product [Rotaria socialis]|uniref:Golgin subfamily A member 7/ERF4 domain-containing protein n=1 Tax=Rotaria socialis TaxID=392032 RepID=A0A821ACA7_9BILA|nr:unnamed protein product [Rotaria socialis]CAF3329403.1 unnamed protein product [Rotaria socialis]CAF3469818.1 unnamed protein product [Rotaria socialis]CAF3585430.1 unnamed protein product [Rotaria socialis]CAF3683646.1 unnamed protein product [Rotaria socialis]
MNEVDIIPEQNPLEISRTNQYTINDDSNDLLPTYIPRLAEPIIIRGAGHVTVFALNNKFDEEYPQALTHKVSRDEYQETIKRVNLILRKNVPINFKWLLCGCICCCCTIGLSLCPVLCLNKRSKDAVSKVLDWENARLYHKLGLHWQLTKQKCPNNAVQEYVLMIEFRPPLSLSHPD